MEIELNPPAFETCNKQGKVERVGGNKREYLAVGNWKMRMKQKGGKERKGKEIWPFISVVTEGR